MTNPDREELVKLADLRSANVARQKEWDAGNQITLAYRGNELAGEVGEACNVIKKLERERLGIAGSRDTVAHLAEELADVVICADLIAMHEGIDLLGEAVPAKFNATSEKVGLKTRLASSDSGVKGEPEPYAYEYGKSNGDGTYSVVIERPPLRAQVSDWPTKPLYTAPPADAGMREAVQQAIDEASYLASIHAHHTFWSGLLPYGWDTATEQFGRNLAHAIAKAIKTELPKRLPALTAPGATTKSDGGVSLNDVREALERSIRELEYNRANHYSPDITTINRLKSQVLQAITKSDGGGESRPANPGTGGRAPCIEQTTPATMPAQAGVAPGPSDPSSTRSDPNEQAYADLIASGGIFPEAYQQREPSMNDDQIKYMVDRFLMWNLPEHFSPDCGISFDQSYRSEHGPVGTNLFDAVQATAMVRHMLEGLPSTRSEVTVESIAQHVRRAIVNNYLPMQSMTREIIGDDAARALLDQFEIRRK